MTYEEPSRATTEPRTVNTILKYIFKSWLNQFFLFSRWIPREMTAEKRGQKFHSDDVPSPRSG